MIEKEINKFVNYCKEYLNLESIESQPDYGSLPLCIIDTIFSLRAKYQLVINVTQRYADNFLENQNRFASGHTISDFVTSYETCNDPQDFTNNYIGRNNQIAGRLKIIPCYELAKKLQKLGIETIEDFQKYQKENEDCLECLIRSVKGFGPQATNYLFMLSGDSSRVKVDTHINHCMRDVFKRELTNDEVQELFKEVVKILKKDYPSLTVSRLDHAVWLLYSNNNMSIYNAENN